MCIFFQNLEYEYIREDLGYGTIDLLCDVGGTLSLLMGASLLTCCELLEVAWIMIVKKCCRKISKTISGSGRRKGTKKNKNNKNNRHHLPPPQAPIASAMPVDTESAGPLTCTMIHSKV